MVFPANFTGGSLNTPQPNCFTIQEVWETCEEGNGTQMIVMMYHDHPCSMNFYFIACCEVAVRS